MEKIRKRSKRQTHKDQSSSKRHTTLSSIHPIVDTLFRCTYLDKGCLVTSLDFDLTILFVGFHLRNLFLQFFTFQLIPNIRQGNGSFRAARGIGCCVDETNRRASEFRSSSPYSTTTIITTTHNVPSLFLPTTTTTTTHFVCTTLLTPHDWTGRRWLKFKPRSLLECELFLFLNHFHLLVLILLFLIDRFGRIILDGFRTTTTTFTFLVACRCCEYY